MISLCGLWKGTTKDGKPYLAFGVQGGDGQDQNLLQFFLNVVEFDMNLQEAAESANRVSGLSFFRLLIYYRNYAKWPIALSKSPSVVVLGIVIILNMEKLWIIKLFMSDSRPALFGLRQTSPTK